MPEEETKQMTAMRHYMALLNEANNLGLEEFARLIDKSTDAELGELLQAANVIRNRIARHREGM